VVAPATANTIGKLANGIADDMLTTTLLATTAPVWIAPAMNVHMYDNPAVQKNILALSQYGHQFIEPSEGYLACGYVGKGRLEEPEKIVSLIEGFFAGKEILPLKGMKVMITAGPTREKVDPVRYFTNHSSGKMGYAIAEEANQMGAEVILISGPVAIAPPSGVTVIKVESAEDMHQEVLKHYSEMDIVIKSAAVADYRPRSVSDQKMKKQDGPLSIEMERTKDILKDLGERKENQVLVGFAAETENVEDYALRKLRKKNLDMIVANNVTLAGAGFGTDTNIVTMYKKSGEKIELPVLSKQEVAKKILEEVSRFNKGV
jgi:phosphopantothenoylcysteine decarboxylase/phosphopantothenate--cysteine ligase